MTLDLTRIKATAEAATPGPWRSSWDDPADEVTGERPWLIKSSHQNAHPMLGNDVVCLVYWDGDNLGCTKPDASFIAACDPTTVLALIAEIEAYRADIEQIAGFLNSLDGDDALDQIRLVVEYDRNGGAPMTPQHLAEIARRAKTALKHSGKGEWDSHERIVGGSIDAAAEKPFAVCHVDPDDALPVCAGEAIAAYIEAAQPSVVIALVAEIERLRRFESLIRRSPSCTMCGAPDNGPHGSNCPIPRIEQAAEGDDDEANGVPA